MSDYYCLKCKRNHNLFGSKIGEAHKRFAFTLPDYLREALVKAAMTKQQDVPTLIKQYVEQGLVRDGLMPGKKIKVVWVPKGYTSEEKIKEDDLPMVHLEDVVKGA